jgi:hypothetical protein
MNYYNYFTEIEEHFVRRRGKSLLVSPMDWSLIEAWRDTGVPLHVALRGIDVAMDAFFAKKHRQSEKVNTLFYCHDSVMAEYARHLESHLGENPPDRNVEAGEAGKKPAEENAEGPDQAAVERFLAERIAEIKVLQAKQSAAGGPSEEIERVLSRLDEISQDAGSDKQLELESLERDLGILDEALVLVLRSMIPPESMEEWEKEAKKELKVYRKRLPKDTYARILENFRRSRIHRHFGVGELSLFHL